MNEAALTASMFLLPTSRSASNAILQNYPATAATGLQEGQEGRLPAPTPVKGASNMTTFCLVPPDTQNGAIHEDQAIEASQAGQIAKAIKGLVENGFINDARRLLEQHQRIRSAKLDRWRRLLAPAEVRESDKIPAPNFFGNQEWMKRKSSSFNGKWVALRDGEFVDADQSRRMLCRRLKTLGSRAGILLVKIQK